MTSSHTKAAPSITEPSFQIDGQVIAVFPGSGLATLLTHSSEDVTVHRGTSGIHFERLSVGDWVNCKVAVDGGRVLHAHQQTQPMSVPSSVASNEGREAPIQVRAPLADFASRDSRRPPSLTREEFIAAYCRRRGLDWADISKYRVAIRSDNATGWTMASTGCHEDEQTVQGPLEPLP